MKYLYFFLHNFIAHPMLCFDNRKSSLPGRFHEWTWRKYLSYPTREQMEELRRKLLMLPRYYIENTNVPDTVSKIDEHPYGQWVLIEDLNKVINEI